MSHLGYGEPGDKAMSEKPRTWDLLRSETEGGGFELIAMRVHGNKAMAPPVDGAIPVIELEPVLDLLEDLKPANASDEQVEKALKAQGIRLALLKEHRS